MQIDPKKLVEAIVTICAEATAGKPKLPELRKVLLERLALEASNCGLRAEGTNESDNAPFSVSWFEGDRKIVEISAHHKVSDELILKLLESISEHKVWLNFGFEDPRKIKKQLDPDGKILLANISYYVRYPDIWPGYALMRRYEAMDAAEKSNKRD